MTRKIGVLYSVVCGFVAMVILNLCSPPHVDLHAPAFVLVIKVTAEALLWFIYSFILWAGFFSQRSWSVERMVMSLLAGALLLVVFICLSVLQQEMLAAPDPASVPHLLLGVLAALASADNLPNTLLWWLLISGIMFNGFFDRGK